MEPETVYVTCRTPDCGNSRIQVEMLVDPGTQVQCGPCAARITDINEGATMDPSLPVVNLPAG